MTEPTNSGTVKSVAELQPAAAEQKYSEASMKTIGNLKTIAHTMALGQVSQLSLPEIDAVVEQVAQVVPAGNVPGVLLNGLARLPGRRPPEKTVKRDIGLLFKGVRQALDKAVYGATFAGPAAVIWGYQNLLKLSGKDPEESFPEGTWQFYLDYAMREDTARHLTETRGFDALLNRHNINLSEADRVTAWAMSAIHCLHQYHSLLENEWRERVYTYLVRELTANEPDGDQFATLYQQWEQKRPYGRSQDAQANDTYPTYRRRKFDEFFNAAIQNLKPELRSKLKEQIAEAEAERLPAYQKQMSILTYLEADQDSDSRQPIPSLQQLHVGVIHKGLYYLIPACAPRSDQPADVSQVRAQITTLMSYPANNRPPELTRLVTLKRGLWAGIRKRLNKDLLKDLDMLRQAPILINADQRSPDLSLAEIRQTERGVGDHPMTLFDTGQSILFDQSHIFFDGVWAASLAEIMTTEALSWAVYLSRLPQQDQRQSRPFAPALKLQAGDLNLLDGLERVPVEATAQTEAINLKFLQRLRRLFKQRNDLLELTVNDILILYRAIHAATYHPSEALMAQLNKLKADSQLAEIAQTALDVISETSQVNPAMVIPVDASQRAPRDRLHPMTFEVPLKEMDLLTLHQRVMEALEGYKSGSGDRGALYAEFDKLQRRYLAALAGFGMVLSRAHDIANAGETSSIKLLTQMPVPLQKMFDKMPSRFDVLNDIIRGREMFTNVGVAPSRSSLSRFMSAKDDSDKKLLIWGVLTDDNNVMRIVLRDFRPHVGLLAAVKQYPVAQAITKDYLDVYANGLNDFIRDLWRITESSRETRIAKDSETQMLKDLEKQNE